MRNTRGERQRDKRPTHPSTRDTGLVVFSTGTHVSAATVFQQIKKSTCPTSCGDVNELLGHNSRAIDEPLHGRRRVFLIFGGMGTSILVTSGESV